MKTYCKTGVLLGALSVCWLGSVNVSQAQVKRYEPSRPTVSPYLNLFRNDGFDRGLPNYYTFVRPLEQQYRINEQQQHRLRQQSQEITRLESNVETLERRQAEGPLVAPTGSGSWFFRPSTRSRYLDTSRYYRQSGTVRPR